MQKQDFESLIQLIISNEQTNFDRDFLIKALIMLNLLDVKQECGEGLLQLIFEYTGADGVAIRLKNKDDYNYFLSLGFPEEFIELENSLIPSDKTINGLECLCGLVLDDNLLCGCNYCTKYGSFFTDDLDKVIDSNAIVLNLSLFRGRCLKFGYKTTALIPLYGMDASKIGLIQVSSKKKHAFNLDKVVILEGLSLHIGVAFTRLSKLKRCMEK